MIYYYTHSPHEHGLETKALVEYIRKRPGMYIIGKCGDGSLEYDGIYTLFMYALEAVLENMPIIENTIYINNTDKSISIDCKLAECPDSFFPKDEKLPPIYSSDYMISVIAALSSEYVLEDAVSITFTPDELIFDKDFYFRDKFINEYIKRYSTVNPEIKFIYKGTEIFSPHGMKDFIEWKFDNLLLPTIHISGEGIDIAINAVKNLNGKMRNQYTSFNNVWNGCYSSETESFITSTVSVLNSYYGLSLNIEDYYGLILQPIDDHHPEEYYMHEEKFPENLVGALWIKVDEPFYNFSQERTLGSKWLDEAESITVEDFVSKFIETELPKYLDDNPACAKKLRELLTTIRC